MTPVPSIPIDIPRLVGAFTRQPEAPWYLCVVIGALSAVVGIGGAIVLKLGKKLPLPWDERVLFAYIFWLIFMANVGKYTSPMDAMGYELTFNLENRLSVMQ